jgi:hypothetical protein
LNKWALQMLTRVKRHDRKEMMAAKPTICCTNDMSELSKKSL